VKTLEADQLSSCSASEPWSDLHSLASATCPFIEPFNSYMTQSTKCNVDLLFCDPFPNILFDPAERLPICNSIYSFDP
jgi:hypothetical protein